MGQQIAVKDQASLALAVEPTKWMSPLVISCLGSDRWDLDACNDARALLKQNAIDVPAMIAHANDMLAPVEPKWLLDRLNALWKSTVPASSLSAKDWLKETGRLIKHLPFDIIQHAIDETVRNSARGFTPTAGEILAIATPLLRDRRRVLVRLQHVAGNGPKIWRGPRDVPPEERCTPEEARAVLHQFGLRSVFDPDSKPRPRDLRVPTDEELEQMAREIRGEG